MTFLRQRDNRVSSKPTNAPLLEQNTDQDELERKKRALQKRLKTASRGSSFGG